MISLCILTRDDPYIFVLLERFKQICPCDFEVCIGDNGTNRNLSKKIMEKADSYIRITDKELFRGGIPRAHNRIAIECAETYKIFYIDTDEYPIWINPNIEDFYDFAYIIPTLRLDFFSFDKINHIYEMLGGKDYYYIMDYFQQDIDNKVITASTQDRLYNARYTEFGGLCHSVFKAPNHFRAEDAGALLLHNETIRNSKNKERMDELIYEQYQRQNINPFFASSKNVYEWGKRIKSHRFENWKQWAENFKE